MDEYKVMSLNPCTFSWQTLEKCGIDFIGPMYKLPIEIRFAIVCIHYYIKWIELKCMDNATTSNDSNFLKKAFAKEGFSQHIVSGNGSQFLLSEMV